MLRNKLHLIKKIHNDEVRTLFIREDNDFNLPNLGFLKEYFVKEKINGISVDISYKTDKSFIKEFNDVIYLHIGPITNANDLNAIYEFKELKHLHLSSLLIYKKAQKIFNPENTNHADLIFDFSYFENLETLYIDGKIINKNIININCCKNISILNICGYKDKDLDIFSNLIKIKQLTINSSSIKSLKGIEKLNSLECLTLENLRSIKDISHIFNLKNLKQLTIDTCSKIYDYDALSGLENIEEIDISNNRDIKDLKFLPNLKKLKLFRMGESSNVVDGNLSYTDNIEKAYFPRRKHYNR